MKDFSHLTISDYELLDCGEGRRLERFGALTVDRPSPQATWVKNRDIRDWELALGHYDRLDEGQSKWRDVNVFPKEWRVCLDGLTFELRASLNNQVGIFPEQLTNWQWMNACLKQSKNPVRVLNAFAYTGVATLVASAAKEDVTVCHVDGARSAVSWARQNAALSGLEKRPIRWIVDDVLTFLKREVKRNQKYDAFILDPPAFGRGPNASWQLERDLPRLLELVNQLLSDKPCFVILSCHATEWTSQKLARVLEELSSFHDCKAEAVDLVIPSKLGHDLPAGVCGRIHSLT